MHFTVQNSVYSPPGGVCWAAGQSGAQGPVMCGAGLTGGVGAAVLVRGIGSDGFFDHMGTLKTDASRSIEYVRMIFIDTQVDHVTWFNLGSPGNQNGHLIRRKGNR